MKNSLESKFEKAEKKKASPKRKKIKKDPPRVASIVGLGLGLIIALNLAIFLYKTQIEDKRLDAVQAIAQNHIDTLAQDVGRYVTSTREKIQFYTKKPTLAANVVLEKETSIEAVRGMMLKNIDGVFDVKFFTKEDVGLDDTVKPPIRFTQLEMIRNAKKRVQVFPEASQFEKRWIIQFAEPIPFDAGQEVVSVVLVSIDMSVLEAEVIAKHTALGKTILQQKFGANPARNIVSLGEGTVGRSQVAKIPGTFWQLDFTPSYYLLEKAKSDESVKYLIMLGACLGVIGGCFILGRIIGRVAEAKIKEKALIKGANEAAPTTNEQGDDYVNPLYQKADVLDVDISQEDEDLLGLGDVEQPVEQVVVKEEEDILDIEDDAIPDVIFRAYDIRGLAEKEITTELAESIGKALGSEAIDHGQETLVVARDARLSSPALCESLIKGIVSSGCHVLDIGVVPTPLMYFATATLQQSQSGVMVTASHNPGEYNGFKVVMNGKTRCDDDIKAIRRRIIKKDVYDGNGNVSQHDIIPEYIDTIFSDVALAGDITMVIDAGNGVTGEVAPRLFEELGCNVIPLFCELDGAFPNHAPDPSVESNLQALIDKVKDAGADLGVAFDGDGDRLVVVTSSGAIIWPDKLLLMFAKDIVSRNPGTDVVFDVKSTRSLSKLVTSFGGRPIMWKTGHAPMKNKMLETGALIGGEYSGHIFIKDRWFGFDDGMYAAARLIEIVSLQGESLDMMFEEFPDLPSSPEIRVPIAEEKKFKVMEQLEALAKFDDARITNIDGIRVDFSDGWGLVRASNTSANLTLRFEAETEDALIRIQTLMEKELKVVDSSLEIDWGRS